MNTKTFCISLLYLNHTSGYTGQRMSVKDLSFSGRIARSRVFLNNMSRLFLSSRVHLLWAGRRKSRDKSNGWFKSRKRINTAHNLWGVCTISYSISNALRPVCSTTVEAAPSVNANSQIERTLCWARTVIGCLGFEPVKRFQRVSGSKLLQL